MQIEKEITPQEIAVRAHDITVCMERTSVAEFDELTKLGKAVRLALHLRGVQAVSYDLLKKVAMYSLDFTSEAVRPVIELLAEAEFVRLDTEGKTINTVIPNIPFYETLFSNLGKVSMENNFSEPESLTLSLVQKLASSPMLETNIHELGAEKKLTNHIINIGKQSSFIICQRARGKSVLLSPTYFCENIEAYADLVSASGSGRVKKILDLLRDNQGWPLKKIETEREVGGVKLDNNDLLVIRKLAGEGFIPPPAIQTKHSGINHFLFGPKPGLTQIPACKRHIYEAAMALVAAVRQGQFLPNKFAIKSPCALLNSFKNKGYINANTEAIEQYKQIAALRVGKLEIASGWARLNLIQIPENIEAVDMAINLFSGVEPPVSSDESICLSLKQGESYFESLIGRKIIMQDKITPIDEETKNQIDNFLLRGRE